MKPDQWLKGHVDLLILAVLADGPLHGYAIIERIAERSGRAFELPQGSIYPALHRLESERLLASSWSTHSGRRRRVYTATAAGRATLAARSEQWQSFSAAVRTVLGTAP